MRFSSALTCTFAAGAALIPQTFAWGAVGHEVVATIAEMHLHPSVMPKLCHILDHNKCHLASVASWADTIRRQPKYGWTGPLHYIGAVDDYPSETCAFPGEKGWEGRTHINVLHSIRNTSTVLHEFEVVRKATGVPIIHTKKDTEDVPNYVQDALKFLIHFVGDMHQPLHLTNRNRGGNNDKVAFGGHTTNLHTVWDSLLISERMSTLSSNYSVPLPLADVESFLHGRNYDPYVRRLIWEGLLGKWEDELETWLACPAPTASEEPQRELASTWHTLFSLLSSPAKLIAQAVSVSIGMDMNTIPRMSLRDNEEESHDGGLGVDDATLCPYAWAKPIHHLNCDVVFPKELDIKLRAYKPYVYEYDDALRSKYFELDTPAYAGMIQDEWVVEKLLAQAGVRLAGVLNGIFADAENGEIRTRRLSL